VDGDLGEYLHTPVLTKEVIEYLKCSAGGTFVDATVGEGGHSTEILRVAGQSNIIGIDWDEEILEKARKRLAEYSGRVILIHDDFVNLRDILKDRGVKKVDGLLFDLGVSTYHLQQKERGFSFQKSGPLDMRMDKRNQKTAFDIINTSPPKDIESILHKYGEEKWAKRITKAIVKKRQRSSIETTKELAEIVAYAIPRRYHSRRIHPATKTFLALRIAVNGELEKIDTTMREAPLLLKRGGRICVISFHSLEDRIVKKVFKTLESTCICPPSAPYCICGGNKKVLEIITKKPITPQPEEKRNNPRARSAKLRVAQRV
jgi:16S rRNA (cytosine1402-N4)-methyltransferase